jgi:hypothetical protein
MCRQFDSGPRHHIFIHAAYVTLLDPKITHVVEIVAARHERKWLSGRAPPCQGGGREFESRLPLHFYFWRRGQVVKAGVCKTPIVGSIPTVASSPNAGFSSERLAFYFVAF